MERFKATVKEITYNGDGTANLVFAVSAPDCKAVKGFIEKTENSRKNGDLAAKQSFELKIAKWREKRSEDANAYMWQLLDKIAVALSVDKTVDKTTRKVDKTVDRTVYTSLDIYRRAIREVGVFKDVKVDNNAANTLRYSWGLNGKGYLSELIEKGEEFSLIRLYYGSSCYNTKQMSRLIDWAVEEADALSIETRTPEEIAQLKSLWEVQQVG